MCIGRSSYLLRCLEPRMSEGSKSFLVSKPAVGPIWCLQNMLSVSSGKMPFYLWDQIFTILLAREGALVVLAAWMFCCWFGWPLLPFCWKVKSRVSHVQIQPKFDTHNAVSFPVPALHDLPYGLSPAVKYEISQILMKFQISTLFFKLDCPEVKGSSANAILSLWKPKYRERNSAWFQPFWFSFGLKFFDRFYWVCIK